jgi:hypothetical protein
MAGLPVSVVREQARGAGPEPTSPLELHAVSGQATALALSLRVAIWAVLAALFTLGVVNYSLRHGRLILHPIYDDIFYLSDGLQRLEVLYHDGIAGLVREHFLRWPHSPFASYLALASFALLGVHDWAPYAGNAIIVFALLLFVDHLCRGLPMAWRLGAALFALTAPMAAVSVFEFRPDMACGLATAMGVVLLLEVPLSAASVRHRRAAGACFGLALLFKPPIAPLTVALLAVSLALALAREFGWPAPARIRDIWKAARGVLWPAALIGLAPFVFQGRYYALYFRLALFAPQKPIADLRGGWIEQIRYYARGEGGRFLLGDHLYIAAVVVAVGSVWLWLRGQRAVVARLRDQLLPLAIAYAIPTLNPVKQPFFGATFSFLVLFLAIQALAAVCRDASRRPRPRLLAASGVAVMALAGVAWAHGPLYWGNAGDPKIIRSNRMAADISAAIRDLNLPPDSIVFLTAVGGVNVDLLRYLALKDGATSLKFVTLPFEENTGSVGAYDRSFNHASAVLASEDGNGDVYTSLPSGYIQGQLLQMLRARPDYIVRHTFASADGGGSYVLFQRTGPFFGWTEVGGLLSEEGPYPEWSLPRVRWGIGPRSVLSLPASDVARRLVIQGRPSVAGMEMAILLDGVEIGRHTFPRIDAFDRVELSLPSSPGAQRIELRYGAWDTSGPGGRAVLFRRLKVVPVETSNAKSAKSSAPSIP